MSNADVRFQTSWFSRLKRLTQKELRETLRDSRTIITLVLMPLLVYPILSLLFRTVLVSTLEGTLGADKPAVLKIAFESNASEQETMSFVGSLAQQIDALAAADETVENVKADTDEEISGVTIANSLKGPQFAKFSSHKWFLPGFEDISLPLPELVLKNEVDLGISFEFPERGVNGRPDRNMVSVSIVRRDTPNGRAAAEYFQQKLRELNRAEVAQRLRQRGLFAEDPLTLQPIVVAVDPDAPPSTSTFSLASLIPLVLVLMTVTGAVYPAIDLTAGERERGTLETLMAAPVPKVGILMAKFFAVWTVAIFTALLNLLGMALTVWTFQFEKILLGPNGFSLLVILKIFGLLVLFSAFFSALMLAVTSFARSFKEAQAYLIPVILLSMGPGLLAMNPGLKLEGVYCLTPMVNVLLLGRDVINHDVQWFPAVLAILSTAFYAVVAIRFAAHRFGGDDVLYAGQGTLGDLFSRPKEAQSHFTLGAAMVGLALLLPINLVAIGALGRMATVLESQYTTFALLMMLFTFLSFFCVPWLIAVARRVTLRTGFAVDLPSSRFWFPAVLLGLFMWPVLAAFVDQWYGIMALFEGAETAAMRHDALVEMTKGQVEKFRKLPVVVVAFAFAIIPAICEEWFFRGMIMQTLLRKWSAVSAILVSAALFGFFHILSNSAISLDRLIPTTLMGILLGYVCYRSKSIWPGAILHMLHNGCLVFLGYFQPQLSQLSWFPEEGADIPMVWVVPAIVVSTAAIAMLAALKPSDQTLGGVT